MALTTITFDTLRERNNASLDRTGYSLAEDFEGLTAAKRRRVQDLLTERSDLEDLASTQSQREAYGIKQWHDDFVRVKDISEGDDLTVREWSQLRNSKFKRFQRAFSHPHQFVLPRSSPISLQGCLVSADKIPEKLAEDLNLVAFDDCDRPAKRLEKKAQPKSIDRLKQIFEQAVPLQQGHYRLQAIRDDDVELDGTILYTRTDENGDLPNGLTVQHFTSAYAAYRKTLHEGGSYNEEIPNLALLRERIITLNRKVDREWKSDTPQTQKDDLRERANVLLTEYTVVLTHCTAQYKELACTLLDEASSFEDKSGKVNPSAALSKMVAAVSRLEDRRREVIGKGGYNNQDQTVLRDAIEGQESILRDARSGLRDKAKILDSKLQLFGEAELTEPQVDAQVAGVLSTLGVHRDDLARVTLKPLSVYSCKLSEKLSALGTALIQRDKAAALDAAVSMHVIGKFQGVRSCFERIKEHMADDRAIPLARVREFVTQMKSHVDNHQILPDHTVAGYSDVFTSVCDRLHGIEERLTQLSDATEATPSSKLYRDLKSYLEECDLEGMVKALP
ncbi:MAG: hypothetical protein QF793_01705 [Candidatus Peribacteraceae bacterium]|jgi:hypothetical protein|nr:hypothetical protein [Candidatus Peribacteraceae bacterium]|tara:strand:- start:645 stop:2333 length:1689 start_codon:yes stop_codon:yes gene_type:complete